MARDAFTIERDSPFSPVHHARAQQQVLCRQLSRTSVNHVLLVGRIDTITEARLDPDSKPGYVIELAVRRRLSDGRITVGMDAIRVLVPWPSGRGEFRFRLRQLIAVSGLVERNEWRDERGRWQSRQNIVADSIEPLELYARTPDVSS